MDTKERIRDTARRMFNEEGMHAVSVRQIARELDISPGNLSYHYPSKGSLIADLLADLHDANTRAATLAVDAVITLTWIYRAIVASFRNDYEYRGIAGSYADAVSAHRESLELEEELYRGRRERILATLDLAVEHGVLRPEILEDADEIAWSLVFTGRFWLGDARLRGAEVPAEELIARYAFRALSRLAGYLTEDARRDYQALRKGLSSPRDARSNS